MTSKPEHVTAEESPALTKEHPAHLKLTAKLRELEGDGVKPDSDEYVTEVEKFVRAEPQLAAELAKENSYLNRTIARMKGGVEPAVPTAESEQAANMEAIHRQAFGTAQEMRQICNQLGIELKNRAENRLTPLIAEEKLKAFYHSVQPFEDALSSNQTEQAVDAIKIMVRAISSIEKSYNPRVAENTESLKKLGFYLREFGDRSNKLARIYGQSDTHEALDISHSAFRLKDITEEKHRLISQMYSVLTNR